MPEEIITPRELREALPTTQGYILRGHKRNHIWCALIRFLPGADPMAARRRLEELAANLTSATALDEAASGADFPVWAMGLTWPGYEFIGLDRSELFSPELRQGFAARAETVTGRGHEKWQLEQWDPDQRYHVVVIIAAGGKGHESEGLSTLAQIEADFVQRFAGLAALTWLKGHLDRRGPGGTTLENFGFVDGVSQPEFKVPGAPPQTIGPSGWDPNAPELLALVKEPYPSPGGSAPEYGSYLSFLKIEQHRDQFEVVAQQLAAAAGCDLVKAKALVFGRHQDGQSLVAGAGFNDFTSAASPAEWPCASHSRKMNPRTPESRPRRIARRGCLYKEQDRVGVLFQSFQSNLQEQFEFLLRSWANNSSQPEPDCGVDPLVGFDPNGQPQHWPDGHGATVPVSVSGLTTIRGGEYFYFPSIPSLQSLTRLA